MGDETANTANRVTASGDPTATFLLFRLHFLVATIACGSLGEELVDISLAAKHEQ